MYEIAKMSQGPEDPLSRRRWISILLLHLVALCAIDSGQLLRTLTKRLLGYTEMLELP